LRFSNSFTGIVPTNFRSISVGGFSERTMIIRMIPDKSQATKQQSGIVCSPFQVYKIILIPHNQQAETDLRLPQ
jgi:hypothetical protein